jgi:hypothetical protein
VANTSHLGYGGKGANQAVMVAVSVTRIGTQVSFPQRAEVDAFLRSSLRFGVREHGSQATNH